MGKMDMKRTDPMMDTARVTIVSVLPDGASGSEHCRSLCFWIVLRADISDCMSSDLFEGALSFVVAVVWSAAVDGSIWVGSSSSSSSSSRSWSSSSDTV